ncbi:MAG: CinA family nicotinamide mononucleotide deamidase-related protein [Deltaproteobacteria bacterium]|nr:CinA family nicotinamide mononucleotide deamidase-related protein [Deltaproteobacteria bacterium]
MSLKVEIIGIGNELTTGRVLDQNAGYAAGRLSSHGFQVTRIVFIPDRTREIRSALIRAGKRADAVLVTGGLGGTLDDITAEVVAKTFDRPLQLQPALKTQIRLFLKKRGLPWDPSFEKMAWLPEGVELFHPRPKAAGFFLEEKGIPFFFLPGVPAEMRRILDRQVIPLLLQDRPDHQVSKQRIYKIFGLLEPEINCRLQDLEQKDGSVQLGFYPNFPENHLTVLVRADKTFRADQLLDHLETEIETRLGDTIVGRNDQTLESVLGELLRERKMTLSVAESCTGGLIGHWITNVPGSSDYFDRGLVVYSNRAKTDLLGVPPGILKRNGAVSEKTALAMAAGIRERSRSDLGLAVTGIAGPGGGTPEKPVGTVWIALASSRGEKVGHYLFGGRRGQIKVMTAYTALDWVRRTLLDDSFLFSR